MNIRTFVILAALAFIPACALNEAQKSGAISAVKTAVTTAAADYAADGKINEASTLLTALNAVSHLVPQAASSDEAKAIVAAAVTEYTGDRSASGKAVARRIAGAVATGLEAAATPQQKTAIVVAAGVGASIGTQSVAEAARQSDK